MIIVYRHIRQIFLNILLEIEISERKIKSKKSIHPVDLSQ